MGTITRPAWALRSALAPSAPPDGFGRELLALDLKGPYLARRHGRVVTQADLDPLPESVQRYLRFMRVVGRPRDWSFRVGLTGRFRRSPHEPWLRCTTWQYNTAASTRIFHLHARLFGVVPVIARDTYVEGHGRMLVRLFDRFTVADGVGEAFDIGELVTWLNDATLIAPSMLLDPGVRFGAVDERHFTVSVTDHERTVSATVSIDEQGAPLDFETRDRFYADPRGAPLRCRWSTPVEGWREIEGRQLFTRAQAVWHLPAGELVYADLMPTAETLTFDVSPRE